MAHNEHNRAKKGGGFFLIIFGALLLIIAPTILFPADETLGVISFVGGFIIGGLGFYIRFIKKTSRN